MKKGLRGNKVLNTDAGLSLFLTEPNHSQFLLCLTPLFQV